MMEKLGGVWRERVGNRWVKQLDDELWANFVKYGYEGCVSDLNNHD